MSIAFFIIVLLPIGQLLWWWWAHRTLSRISSVRARNIARAALACFMFFALAGYALVLITRGMRVGIALPGAILAPLYLWHILIVPVTLATFVIAWLARKATAIVHSPADHPAHSLDSPSRRQLLAAAAVALPPFAVLTTSATALAQLDLFRIRRMDVPLAALPKILEGVTIALVSDPHIGRFTQPGMLPRIADATNALRADLVMLTGDLIDFSLRDLPTGIDFVRKLDPRGGMFMIEGNHDLFESRERFESAVLDAKIPLLLNQARTIQVRGFDVQILGMGWGFGKSRWPEIGRNFNLIAPLIRRDREVFPILLSHHPHAFDNAIEAGIPLTLSGHTHGGQLMLTKNFGAGSILFKYWSGLYQQNGNALVVSNGVGNWFPLRLNAPAEIVHLTLRRQ